MKNNKLFIYVGSWGNKEQKGQGEGITVLQFNDENGSFRFDSVLKDVEDPGILAVSPDRKNLYSINEMTVFPDGEYATGGGITAMKIDQSNGSISVINKVQSLGSLPAYCCVDNSGKYVLAANHASFGVISRYIRNGKGEYECMKTFDTTGVALFKIRPDGGVYPGCDLCVFETPGSYYSYKHDLSLIEHGFPGKKIAPPMLFQTRPHAHSINFNKNGYGICCERGSDMIYMFRIDPERNRLEKIFSYHARLGVAPRHSTFHPELPYFYITNEMEASVTAFKLDYEAKSFKELQTIRSVEADCTGPVAPSDIHVHPSGQFLYASNRCDDSIAVYSICQETGMLEVVQIKQLGEPSPRGFDIDPSGRYLVVGNMDSHHVVSYEIDPATGMLSDLLYSIDVKSPTCIRFAQL